MKRALSVKLYVHTSPSSDEVLCRIIFLPLEGYDHLDTWHRRRIIHHPKSVGGGRVDIRDIVARREEGRRDRYSARQRVYDYFD